MQTLTKWFFIGLCSLIICIPSYGKMASEDLLVNYVYLGEFPQDIAKKVLSKIPPLDTLPVTHTISLYKIHYKTPAPDGEITVASGLVAMPTSPTKKVATVLYMHGTRVNRNDVPSRNDEKNYPYVATFGSSGGYMTVMPDYLGLGDNDLIVHPYVQFETLASTSINMLRAAKELAKILAYPVNDQLFLTGYSEGGFTTMVTYEELEKNYKEIPITAVAPGSAPYIWSESIRFITLQPGPRSTLYLAYFFYSMQTYKHYWKGLDEIFVKPYDTVVSDVFDGYHQVPEVLDAFPLEPHLIFTETFFNSIINGTNPHSDDLKINFDHYDFKSEAPLLLVGTKGDKDLPYHGAELAYEVLKSKSENVFIKSVSDTLDHVQASPFVLKEQLEFFKHYE